MPTYTVRIRQTTYQTYVKDFDAESASQAREMAETDVEDGVTTSWTGPDDYLISEEVEEINDEHGEVCD